ncbi:hypothetical protein [Neptuniibacter sp. QD37_11]|uniref:hypothetical protein n=1 Tax=Neptuniibacter sp. QD37_11 TaxID=3398209 RepID=UPI0039F5F6CB
MQLLQKGTVLNALATIATETYSFEPIATQNGIFRLTSPKLDAIIQLQEANCNIIEWEVQHCSQRQGHSRSALIYLKRQGLKINVYGAYPQGHDVYPNAWPFWMQMIDEGLVEMVFSGNGTCMKRMPEDHTLELAYCFDIAEP